MSQQQTLNLTERVKVTTREMEAKRKAGLVPVVVYSHGKVAESFWVDYIAFEKLYKVAGQSSVITLKTGKKSINAIIQDTELHPLNSRFTHADFYQVHMDEKLEAHVPLVFVGESKAIRELGGVLVKTVEEIEVRCLPGNLPHEINVDLGKIDTFEDHIQIKDIKLPEGVEALGEPETVVALVDAPRSEAEMAALDEKVSADVTKVEGVVKETPQA